MILLNYYWQFEGALSKQMCKRIIKLGLSKKAIKASTGGSQAEKADAAGRKRDSSVAWLGNDWIYNSVHPSTHIANKNASWNYQWDWTEDIQFGIYKKNQFYGWHTDQGTEHANPNHNSLGKIRKLTSTVQLSDPDTYEGGGIQLDPRNDDPELYKKKSFIDLSRKQGTIICFPSHLWHRAMPVIKGTRYSLTLWHWGYPFR